MATPKKKPQDRKSARHAKSELFEYTVEGVGTIAVPYLENLPGGIFDAVEDAAERGKNPERALAEETFDEEQLELWKQFTLWDRRDFSDKWAEESSLDLGESSAS